MIRKLFPFFKQKVSLEFTGPDGDSLSLPIKHGESVLDTLLNNGIDTPYSCKAGACKSCTMQCSTPEKLPAQSQAGLHPSEIELGYFLACSCTPKQSLVINPISQTSAAHTVKVIEKIFVSENVMRLKLDSPFKFKGGQFCNIYKSDKVFRSYSIASKDNDPHLEFHIKHIEKGQFSGWAAQSIEHDDELTIEGPYGECFYIDSDEHKAKPLLLAGIGTGLAPLLGVLRSALEKQHVGNIELVIGAQNSENFYLTNELTALESAHSNVQIYWLANKLGSASPKQTKLANIYDFVSNLHTDLAHHRVYLCGAPSFIQKMKKQCYLNGANLNNINCDIFQPAQ